MELAAEESGWIREIEYLYYSVLRIEYAAMEPEFRGFLAVFFMEMTRCYGRLDKIITR